MSSRTRTPWADGRGTLRCVSICPGVERITTNPCNCILTPIRRKIPLCRRAAARDDIIAVFCSPNDVLPDTQRCHPEHVRGGRTGEGPYDACRSARRGKDHPQIPATASSLQSDVRSPSTSLRAGSLCRRAAVRDDIAQVTGLRERFSLAGGGAFRHKILGAFEGVPL